MKRTIFPFSGKIKESTQYELGLDSQEIDVVGWLRWGEVPKVKNWFITENKRDDNDKRIDYTIDKDELL